MNSTETKTLKTSVNYWAQEIGGLTLFMVIFPVYAILYLGADFYFLGALAIFIVIIYLFRYFRPAYNAWITIDALEIKGNVEGLAFAEMWSDIIAISFTGQGTTSILFIGTENHILQIPSKFFDRKKLEKEIRTRCSPELFEPNAFQRLPQVRKFEQERKSQFDNLQEALKVPVGKSEKIIGGISIFFSVLILGLLFISKFETALLLLAAIFGGLGLVLIYFSVGTIEANHAVIILKMNFGVFELPWSTLREVYINLYNHRITLTGERCRILLPVTKSWSGKDREQLYEFINMKIVNSGIQPKQGTTPLYWRSKYF